MSTHEQITNNPTSTVRNTWGRNGPRGLKEPMSDEVLREMCDKNYHQLLTLIAEKMQKEKEQKDKLNAVKARLIYGEESGIKIRSHEESHYSESKTPTARTEPRRRHGDRYSRSPSPHASVFKRLKKNRSPSPRPRPQKKRGVFNRLGRKESATSAHSDSHQCSPQAKRTEVERRRHQKGTTSYTTSRYSESEDSEGGFGENYLQQTKHIKDPVEIHHIKQRDGESTEDFMERYMTEVLDVEGAPECMIISWGSCSIQSRPEKSIFIMETVRGGNKPNFKKSFKNKQRPDHKQDRFSLLTKTPKEIFALEKGKFKAPPPMVTLVEKRDPNKYCEFHSDTGHSTDECMQLRKQIDEMIKAEKLSQFIKELKQNDKTKAPKKREASGKDKPLTILMIQPWERMARPRITQSFSSETAISFPPLGEEGGTDDPMIIEAEMGGHFVHRVYVDGGASSEVFGETIWPLGQIALLVKIGDEVHSTSAWMNFMVIRSPSQHNAIIGRPGIRKIRAVPSTAHGMLKFPVEGGTVTLQSSRVIPMECAMISGPSIQAPAVNQVLEEKINIAIHPEYPEQTVAIGSTLTEKGRKELCSLLKQNLDIFAWKPADMTGVPRNIAEHRLNIREGYSPVRQKKRGQAPERNKVIQEEVEKLVDAGIMKEILTTPCPKELYPLPEIDWKVESLCGYSFKCFLDAYKGYHQIKMAKEDEEKTAFITSQGIFCYSKMPFGLKNVGSTYQRLVDKAFQKQIGRNLEVYVDDLVIKSHTEEEIVRDITETFKTLRQINMKLNPKKCTFGMQEGMFLGYKVSTNGLRACPEKADAVLSLPSPRCIKDVQKLNGKLASLNRFLSKSAEKSLPFFKTLKKCTKERFQWTPKAKSKRSYQRGLDDGQRRQANTSIFYGSSCVDGSGAGLILTNPEGAEFTYAMRFRFEATNNEAEYEALIAGLRIAEQMGHESYLNKVKKHFAKSFKEFSIKQIPRSENKKADALSKIASTSFAHLNKQVLVEELKEKSINEKEILDVVEEEGNTWMTPISEYLTKEILPEDRKKGQSGTSESGQNLPTSRNHIRQWKAISVITITKIGSLGEGIKARLDEKSKDWIEELPHVLWAHRTMIKSNQTKNNEALGINLDLIEERRELAAIQEAKSKKKMEKYYNSRVRGTSFKPGEMVYRSNEASHAKDEGKLGPKWEGPYEVKESLGKGAYKLKDCKGNEMPRTWNICNLKKCYVHEL
ncbi:reverse transcriptase domain-containing protein [Tanacetum coccineum]